MFLELREYDIRDDPAAAVGCALDNGSGGFIAARFDPENARDRHV
jgi:hypothetical protein